MSRHLPHLSAYMSPPSEHLEVSDQESVTSESLESVVSCAYSVYT